MSSTVPHLADVAEMTPPREGSDEIREPVMLCQPPKPIIPSSCCLHAASKWRTQEERSAEAQF